MDKRKIKKQHERKFQEEIATKQKKKERLSKSGKIILVAIGVAAMVLSVTSMACSGFINMRNKPDYELTGGVAAEVDGVAITEDTITKQIMSSRESLNLQEDDAWAQHLVDNDLTPDSLREMVIQSYIDQVLISNAIAEYNIEVSQEEIDDAWNQTVANYDSEKDFVDMLEQIGYTKDSYRKSLADNLAKDKLHEVVAPKQDPSDEEIVSYYNENIDSFNNARKSSHILFAVNEDGSNRDEQLSLAQEVLDQINSGEITFEDAAQQYSDDGSGADGGNVGWDVLTSFVPEYQEALDELAVGQVSQIVESQFGFHIIQCTDIFATDGSIDSCDVFPSEIVDYISNAISGSAAQQAYSDWQNDYRESSDIVINPMPENVPYNVSLDGVEPSATQDSDVSENLSESDEGTSES